MEKKLFSSHPEPINGRGEIVIGISWPTVQGRAMRAIQTLHPRWVTTLKCGSRNVTQLNDRGYAILNLTVPVHVRGFGPYRGLSWKKR